MIRTLELATDVRLQAAQMEIEDSLLKFPSGPINVSKNKSYNFFAVVNSSDLPRLTFSCLNGEHKQHISPQDFSPLADGELLFKMCA